MHNFSYNYEQDHKDKLNLYLSNQKETNQLHNLLDKACILWQYYEKEHVDENMSDEEWKDFVQEKYDDFSNGCCEVLESVK